MVNQRENYKSIDILKHNNGFYLKTQLSNDLASPVDNQHTYKQTYTHLHTHTHTHTSSYS